MSATFGWQNARLHRLRVVESLRRLVDGMNGRGLGAGVEARPCRRRTCSRRRTRRRRSAASSPSARPVERLAEKRDELRIVGDRDRRVAVGQRRRLVRAEHVRVEGKGVHDRRSAAARAIGGAHVEDELGRRVRLAGDRRIVGAGVREDAAEHLVRGRERLQRVVGLREQRDVRTAATSSPFGPNCGSQKRFRFGSLPMMKCFACGTALRDCDHPGGEVALVLVGERRHRAPERIEREIDPRPGARQRRPRCARADARRPPARACRAPRSASGESRRRGRRPSRAAGSPSPARRSAGGRILVDRADEHVRAAGKGGRGKCQSGDSDEENAEHLHLMNSACEF